MSAVAENKKKILQIQMRIFCTLCVLLAVTTARGGGSVADNGAGNFGSVADNGAGNLDVKIARGLGAHGYSAVRISVTERKQQQPKGRGKVFLLKQATPRVAVDTAAFSYNAPFKHRWLDQTLHTVLLNATPGENNTYRIGTDGDNNSLVRASPGKKK